MTTGDAYSSYKSHIPNGDNVKDCNGVIVSGVGHTRPSGGGERNPFGQDFSAAGFTWSNALCRQDSDGDGISNGAELGDPDCLWVQGNSPQFNVGITHPGINCGTLSCDGTASSAPSTAPALDGCDVYQANSSAYNEFTFTPHPVAPGTSYPKQYFRWPESTASAVVRFEFVNNNPQVVHHMLLYRCSQDVSGTYGTPVVGNSMGCTDVLMAWAVGGVR